MNSNELESEDLVLNEAQKFALDEQFHYYFDVLADDFCDRNERGDYVMRASCDFDNTDESNSLPGSPAKLKAEPALDSNYFKRKEQEEEKRRRSAQFNTGRWTPEEHDLFLEALRIDGKDWDLIEQHVKTRDAAHIRSHAQKFFSKLVRFLGGEEMENPIQDAAVYLEILQRKVEKPHRKKSKAAGLQEASQYHDTNAG